MTMMENISDGEICVIFQEFKNITSCVDKEVGDFFDKCLTNDFLELTEI